MRKSLRVALWLTCLVLVLSGSILSAGEIHDACQAGDLDKVKRILREDPEQIQAVTPEGKSPLHMATGWGQKEIVLFLLKEGANINALNNQGGTPIHVAASRNQPECAAILLDHGADMEAIRVEGSVTPLAIAVFKNNLEIAEFLLSRGANLNAQIMNGVTILQASERRAS
ncbi:MAG: ankyrin repeat protein, partial [uncultured bacterium]